MKPLAGWRLSDVVATWFGCGYTPIAPGTAGSLGALAVAGVMVWAFASPPYAFGALAALMLPSGVWAARQVEERTGRKDPQIVVIDEVLGQWLTLAGATHLNWKSWLLAFVLFRIFDTWKPLGVRRLESLSGGWGVVADDLLAGLYGALVLFAAGCFNLY